MACAETRSEREDFAAVYDMYYGRIFKYAYSLLLNREDAEDVTADTFLAAYANYDRYDPGRASVATWLTRIAHNRAVNFLRSPAHARRGSLPEWRELPDAADHTGRIEASDTVLRLYARLRPDERELLNMRCVMELKFSEIAALLCITEKTANKRWQRLLAKCRTLLED